MTTTFKLDDRAVRERLQGVDVRTRDMRPAWAMVEQYMRVRTDEMFPRLRHGGVFRGVKWSYFAPQYIRASGVVVPAWGGTPKVRGRGAVKGRKRPSGARVASGDAILQDTGTLRSRAAVRQMVTNSTLRLGTALAYARPQDKRRPFLFFQIPQDANAIEQIMLRWLLEARR